MKANSVGEDEHLCSVKASVICAAAYNKLLSFFFCAGQLLRSTTIRTPTKQKRQKQN